MGKVGKDNRMLYDVVPAGDVREDDILLEPCYDELCDGPWHEHIVLERRLDGRVYLTTVGDTSRFATWVRRLEEPTAILPRLARQKSPSGLDAELRRQLACLRERAGLGREA